MYQPEDKYLNEVRMMTPEMLRDEARDLAAEARVARRRSDYGRAQDAQLRMFKVRGWSKSRCKNPELADLLAEIVRLGAEVDECRDAALAQQDANIRAGYAPGKQPEYWRI